MTAQAQPKAKSAEPWRQRLVRSLLYGRNVDRAAKARARVGFTMVAFAGVYAVIAAREPIVAALAGAGGLALLRWARAERPYSSALIAVLSPGITISTPSGRCSVPVTSVVRM